MQGQYSRVPLPQSLITKWAIIATQRFRPERKENRNGERQTGNNFCPCWLEKGVGRLHTPGSAGASYPHHCKDGGLE
jgi:hypothetical protein